MWCEKLSERIKSKQLLPQCLNSYLIVLNICSIHLFFCSILGCTYRFSVVLMFECPSSTLTVL